MQDIPQEQIDRRFQAIAESLQDAIFSERTADAIRKSCILREAEEYMPTIAILTGRALLGYVRPETFAFEIQKEAGIDALKATQVAHDIDTEIFSEVRLELKKLYPPTIQTPTVQAPGFIPKPPLQATSYQPQAKPKYVVPIPERFRKTTPWPQQAKEESGIKSQELGMKPAATPTQPEIQEEKATPVPTPSPASSPTKISTENLGGQAAAQKPAVPPQSAPSNEATSYKLQADEGPAMEPVVPLPTFIQSKFKTSELGMAGQESRIKNQELGVEQKTTAPQTQDALKSAFGKFTVSSTATEVKKEPANPYREPIEEPKKPTEQKPTAKVQGKVIDLSKF